MRTLDHTVICPDPACDWKASGGFEIDETIPEKLTQSSWRIGVIREAVEAERLAHVRHLHVRTGTR